MARLNTQIIGYSLLAGALALPSFFVPQSTSTVEAEFSVPSFPSCVTYSGTIQAKYDHGMHAIVGNPTNQEGSDVVYDLGSANYLQCFCPLESVSNDGIQTDWLAAGSLDDATISELMNQGWYYIGAGQDWGLDSMPFLAKNSNFACNAAQVSVTPTPTPTIQPGITPTPTTVPAQNTPTPTPTGVTSTNPTATPTPKTNSTVNPTATPTPTPTGKSTVTSTPTPTPTVVPLVGGISAEGTPTPTPVQEVVPSEVTKLAATGTFVQSLMNLILASGFIFATSAGALYGKSKKA
jgi:hypothetical protein